MLYGFWFFTGVTAPGFSVPDITWHGVRANEPDWTPASRFIACLICGEYARQETGECDADIYMAFNPSPYTRVVTLPDAPNGMPWKRVIDTSLPFPEDFLDEAAAPQLPALSYKVKRRSMIVLVAE